jgi:CPA2 family monovalent cation:H+ antiporter-2
VPSAAVDIVLNATPGALAGWLLGLDGVGILALAGVTYVSSSGLIARLLEDLHRLGNRETPAVLSVLVLEDFAMAAYLPLFAVLASGRSWLLAIGSMAVAVVALWVAFTASYRWGHHVGRLVRHADSEQLLLRVLGITLIVAALAEHVHASAAVGAFLVGLTLTGETADRARKVLGPLRDLFAAIFFLAIGLLVDPHDLLPMLPVAIALAAVTAATKVATGVFAARREGVARRGQLRAGTTLIARAEFSLIIIGVVDSSIPGLAALATAYVFVVAIVGPVLARLTGGPSPTSGRSPQLGARTPT